MSKAMVLLDGAGLVQAVAQDHEEAWEVIKALAQECEAGKSDRVEEAAELGFQFQIAPSQVYPLFRKARAARPTAVFSLPKTQPKVGQLRIRPIRDPEPEPRAKVATSGEGKADGAKKPEQPKTEAKGELVVAKPLQLLLTPSEAAYGPEQAVKEMNERHAVISNLGGKCVVMEWVPSEIDEGGDEPSYQSFHTIRERYANRYVKVVEVRGINQINKSQPLGEWWLANPARRQYERLDLDPHGPAVLPGNRLNLWRGWGVEPKEADWSLLDWHILSVIANNDLPSYEYIRRWLAWKFQNPALPPEVALAFRGKKGTGKGVLMHAVLSAFGQHGIQVFNREHLLGKHNKLLQNRLLLCCDEALWAGDREAERVLKGMVTEKTLVIEPKGVDSFNWRNRLGLIFSANAEWVVPATSDERRFAVFDVSSKHMQDDAYFKPLFAEIDGGGAAAMLWDLIRFDLKGWHPRNDIPKTKALRDQMIASLNGKQQWWLAKLHTAETPTPWSKNPRWVLSERLLEEAKRFTQRNSYLEQTEFGRFMGEMGCEHKSNGKAWGWVFPPISEARAAWEREFGPTDWLVPDAVEWNYKPKEGSN